MAVSPTVTLVFEDARGKRTRRRYESRLASIDDPTVVSLATAMQALTKLSVVECFMTRPVSIAADTAEAGCSVNDTASIRARKGDGGTYTFNIPEPLDAVVTGDNVTLDVGNSIITDWLELFDDGTGVAATQGPFYVSDGEQLDEDNPAISGEMDTR